MQGEREYAGLARPTKTEGSDSSGWSDGIFQNKIEPHCETNFGAQLSSKKDDSIFSTGHRRIVDQAQFLR